jgi:nucleotide-binding universal stress UspA family protein
MTVLVGYTATKAGADAVAAGARLAAAIGASVALVLVLPSDDRSVITPPDAGYDRYLRGTAEQWLADAAAKLPDGVAHTELVRRGESFAEGLIETAAEIGASHIVVGAANGGLRGRHRLGSTATELVHYADVPVVLVPRGARKIPADAGVPRLTVAVGTRAGREALMDAATALAAAAHAPLRLLSLVTVDLPASVDTGVIRIAGAAHADEVLTKATSALPETVEADVVVGQGESIEDAVSHLDWEQGEFVLVGSSRLAQRGRLFLGATAAKMLHELPVPMIVVPRPTTGSEAGA